MMHLLQYVDDLDSSMARVQQELAAAFFLATELTRQGRAWPTITEHIEECQATQASEVEKPPKQLHTYFKTDEIIPWDEGRFTLKGKLCDALRNKGVVELMIDVKTGEEVAVKSMPQAWMCASHEDFVRKFPKESELPWQDLGCTRFLNDLKWAHACQLKAVYQSEVNLHVALSYEAGGDMFTMSGQPWSPEREHNFARLAMMLMKAVTDLHELGIAHQDISVENVLLSHPDPATACLKIIDFAMATTQRTNRGRVRGKPSYQAPEMHTDSVCDNFLGDSFAVGVVLYVIFLRDYPWLSTKPGNCKCFDFTQKHGFPTFLQKRKPMGQKLRVCELTSPELQSLFIGLCEMDASRRLTMGATCQGDRKSIWQEPFSKMHISKIK